MLSTFSSRSLIVSHSFFIVLFVQYLLFFWSCTIFSAIVIRQNNDAMCRRVGVFVCCVSIVSALFSSSSIGSNTQQSNAEQLCVRQYWAGWLSSSTYFCFSPSVFSFSRILVKFFLALLCVLFFCWRVTVSSRVSVLCRTLRDGLLAYVFRIYLVVYVVIYVIPPYR